MVPFLNKIGTDVATVGVCLFGGYFFWLMGIDEADLCLLCRIMISTLVSPSYVIFVVNVGFGGCWQM